MNFTTLTDYINRSSVYFDSPDPPQNIRTNWLVETPKIDSSGPFRSCQIAGAWVPFEAFIETFQYLDTQGLLAARKTCKDWKRITDYVVCHKNFKSKYQLSDEVAGSFIYTSLFGSPKESEMLLNYGSVKHGLVNVNRNNNFHYTPLIASVLSNNLVLVKRLLEKGAIVDDMNVYQFTPTIIAVRNGYIEILNALADAGADLNVCMIQNKSSLLHIAAGYDRAAIVRRLIELGLNSSVKNNYGHTPLHVAASRGYVEIVNILLSAGVDIDAKDDGGKTALEHAILFKHYRVVYALLHHQFGHEN